MEPNAFVRRVACFVVRQVCANDVREYLTQHAPCNTHDLSIAWVEKSQQTQ
jgi:hypothetical protein